MRFWYNLQAGYITGSDGEVERQVHLPWNTNQFAWNLIWPQWGNPEMELWIKRIKMRRQRVLGVEDSGKPNLTGKCSHPRWCITRRFESFTQIKNLEVESWWLQQLVCKTSPSGSGSKPQASTRFCMLTSNHRTCVKKMWSRGRLKLSPDNTTVDRIQT